MTRLFPLLIFLTAVALPLPAATPAEEEAIKYRSYIDEGISLLRTGVLDDIHRSLAKFTSARKLRPESAEPYYWIALGYSDLNNYRRAAENARDATVYDDTLPEAWLLWGQVLLYQREWHEALDKLQAAARLAPDNPFVQYNLGRVHYHGFKDPDTALARFRTAWLAGQSLRRDNPEMIPLTVSSRLYMGCCEYDRGMRQNSLQYFDNAVKAFSDVVREQPYNYDAQFRLALALRRAGRVQEGRQILSGIAERLRTSNDQIDRQLLAEAHLQLADIDLKEQGGAVILVPDNLRHYISLIGGINHPALEAAREYLAITEQNAGPGM